jgi:hypothetical protein
VEEFVAKENIRRFEAQLAECTDEQQRSVLLGLIEEQRMRLADILRKAALAASLGNGEAPGEMTETRDATD